ncbi:hypothetical protein G9A89_022698 [Geosiphon pyriformis]|nr:hypothetical protein G9A89_022698 [Geosiphon pyriformis]
MNYNGIRQAKFAWLHFSSHCIPHKFRIPNSSTLFFRSRRYSHDLVNPISTSDSQQSLPFVAPINIRLKEQEELLRLIFDNSETWRAWSQSQIFSFFTTNSTGLFRNPELTTPQSFQVVADKVLNKAKLLVENISNANTDKELRQVVKSLDKLSNTLCSIIDLAEFVRTAHPDQNFAQAANHAYEYLCSYMNTLNTNTKLYKVLKRVLSTSSISSKFSTEELQVANVFLRDFEKSGIHLPAKQREKFVQLSDKIITLGRKFYKNPSTKSIRQIEVSPLSRLGGLTSDYIQGITIKNNNCAIIPTSPWDAQMILKYARDEEVRKDMYVASNSASRSQLSTLEDLLRTRAELANLIGMESYGHMFLIDKMVKSPDNVKTFLRTLADHHRPKALKDLLLLQEAKRRYIRQKTLPTICAWDRDYYTTVVLSESSSQPLAAISPYFSIGSVIQGLSQLFSRLYGISFQPAEILPGEVWHDDVRKLEVIDEAEGKVGTIYCDLFNRHGKFQSAAHYTVRCSRRVDDDDDYESGQSSYRSDFNEINNLTTYDQGVEIKGKSGLYQLPVVVLMCDFNKANNQDQPTTLSWVEVETLFHEMGHAMHSMIGRTEFHNVSGTRCPTDFVELPSILMEHFVSSPQVLSLFAYHFDTREPIPPKLIQSHARANSTFAAIETQSQIVMALLDQLYHSELANTPSFDTTTILANLQDTVGIFPSVPKTAWQIQFGHLFGYGSGYYSYLFGKVLAGKIWKEIFSKDPLSRDAGQRFREEVLKWGGSRDPWICIGNALKDDRIVSGDNVSMSIVGDSGYSGF